MTSQRRQRLGRTGWGLGVVGAFAAGMAVHVEDGRVAAVAVVALLLFAGFSVVLLSCLDVAAQERDEWKGKSEALVASTQEVVDLSARMVAAAQAADAGRQAYLSGERSVMERLVEEARAQGVDIEYVPLDDLEEL